MIEEAVARVHGRRVHLLGRRGLIELAAQPDLASRIDALRRAGLVPPGFSTLRGVMVALRAGLARDVARVDTWLTGKRAGELLRAFHAQTDGWSLVTVLRGVEHGEPPARLLELVAPAVELDEGALKELVAQRTVKDILDLLTTWRSPLAKPLSEAVAGRKGAIDLPAIEVAIHRFLFARTLAAARRAGFDGGLVASIVRTQIDMTNVSTLVKLAGKSATRELFIEGGALLPRARFEKIAALGTREAHAALAEERTLDLREAFDGERIDPFRLDRLAQRRLLGPLRRPSLEHPLSIAVPLRYLIERQEETRAIRLLLEAGELGLPASEALDLIEGAP